VHAHLQRHTLTRVERAGAMRADKGRSGCTAPPGRQRHRRRTGRYHILDHDLVVVDAWPGIDDCDVEHAAERARILPAMGSSLLDAQIGPFPTRWAPAVTATINSGLALG